MKELKLLSLYGSGSKNMLICWMSMWLLGSVYCFILKLSYGNLRLSLSVAFDEDFEAELADNNDARLEVSILASSPDPELTEVSYWTFKRFV